MAPIEYQTCTRRFCSSVSYTFNCMWVWLYQLIYALRTVHRISKLKIVVWYTSHTYSTAATEWVNIGFLNAWRFAMCKRFSCSCLLYWVPTDTWNSTQLLLHGSYLLYWMLVTAYQQKHETALHYYRMAITCYTGCWLLRTNRNMKQHSVITAWQLPAILAAGYWVPTETWNSTQLLPHGN